ncbi:MAG: tRNA pseudouridine(55) synthase TruB [Sphingomicrobium sp.]
MINGWIILDKPVGIGSTPCVSAVKRALREAAESKQRVGHGGTLDPMASGVLPIAIGEATKLAGRMLDASKDYVFTIAFGSQTDTLDLEGEEIATSPVRPTAFDAGSVLPLFTGPIEQIPPAYSALKVDGERAFSLARRGDDVVLKPRQVTIHDLRLIEFIGEGATYAASVSKGTYIRSLARDIALALGTVGHVIRLRRTRAGPFTLGQAISLDKLTDLAKARSLDGAVLPLIAGLDDIPALPVSPEEATLLRHGQKLDRTLATPGLVLATDAGRPVALVEAGTDGLRVVRGFNI